MHTPVLLNETIEALQVEPGKRYIDATFGLGGHAQALLEKGALVLGLEWDEDSLKIQKEMFHDANLKLVQGNYADIEFLATKADFVPVDGVLFDLGLSMWQIREGERGMSYEKDNEKLDMRINRELKTTAADIVNSYSKEQLYDIFSKYGEEIDSGSIVHSLDQFRHVKKFETVGDLKKAIMNATKRNGTIARIFQALRMEVNQELESIQMGIKGAMNILKPGGRLAIITFHPTEDRLVKSLIRKSQYTLVRKFRKGYEARSFEKSAMLRVIEKS